MTELTLARRRAAGAVVPHRTLTSLRGESIDLPDPRALTHLQFRRFAGCPVCDLHLQSIAKRHAELAAAGVREVVLFHSTAAELRAHGADRLPFPVIADPNKQLYYELGVESGARALLDPRAWLYIARAIARTSWAILCGRARAPSLRPRGGRYGLPADFLLASDGRVLACHYGSHAYDQWSVDDVLTLARTCERTLFELGDARQNAEV